MVRSESVVESNTCKLWNFHSSKTRRFGTSMLSYNRENLKDDDEIVCALFSNNLQRSRDAGIKV